MRASVQISRPLITRSWMSPWQDLLPAVRSKRTPPCLILQVQQSQISKLLNLCFGHQLLWSSSTSIRFYPLPQLVTRLVLPLLEEVSLRNSASLNYLVSLPLRLFVLYALWGIILILEPKIVRARLTHRLRNSIIRVRLSCFQLNFKRRTKA